LNFEFAATFFTFSLTFLYFKNFLMDGILEGFKEVEGSKNWALVGGEEESI
jgi:hypothetical protein